MAQRLIVEIIGDASSLDRTFRDTSRKAARFEAKMTGLGRSAARFGAAASVGFYGTQGLIRGLETSVEAASNLGEQMSKTELVFGESAGQVKDWSKTSAQAMGLARDEALQTASSLGALLRPLGVTGDEAARQSQRLTQLGADLASFYNTDVADALAAIQSGLVGESEPLRRYGVLLSEARVQQEAMLGTGKKNADQLTDTDKVLARIRLTLKDSAQAQGNFALTSEDAANNLRTLEANARNTAATIGGKLLPVLNAAAGAINDAFAGGNFGAGVAYKRLLDAGVLTLGRGYDAVEAARGQRGRIGVSPHGLVGGATAGRRPSAAFTRLLNRQAGQRNQWFDSSIGRMLGRVGDITSLRGQVGRLGEIAGLIRKRLEVTKDVTRRLTLEDQLADVLARQRQTRTTIGAQLAAQAEERKRAAAAAKQAAIDEKFGWLDFAIERAETTKTLADDRKVLRNKERFIQGLIRSEGRTLELVRDLWRTRQQIRDLNKQNADRDPLAGLMQVSSQRLAGVLAAGTGLGAAGRGRLEANIAAQGITVYSTLTLDGQQVGRSVTRHQAKTANRTARQTSGYRG